MMESLTENFLPLLLVALWVLPWKGIALWRAARNGDKIWFVIIFLLNTLAVLEIIYIFVFSRRGRNDLGEKSVNESDSGGTATIN